MQMHWGICEEVSYSRHCQEEMNESQCMTACNSSRYFAFLLQPLMCRLCVKQTSTHMAFAPIPKCVHLALLVCKHVALGKRSFVINPQIPHQGLHTSSDAISAYCSNGLSRIELLLCCKTLNQFVRLTQHPDDALLGQSGALSCSKSVSNASLVDNQ